MSFKHEAFALHLRGAQAVHVSFPHGKVCLYQVSYSFDRTTIHTEYNVLIKAHDFSGGFQCAICGPHPQAIIMDATALSFRKDLDFWKEELLADIPDVKVPKGR